MNLIFKGVELAETEESFLAGPQFREGQVRPVLSLVFLLSLVVESEDPSSHSTHLREVRESFPILLKW